MLIVMSQKTTKAELDTVVQALEDMGLRASPIPGSERPAVGVLGNEEHVDDSKILDLPGIEEIIHVSKPYKMVSRDFHPQSTVVTICGINIGEGCRPVIAAGPCAVEDEEQIIKTALAVKAAGANLLRGGAFKPRTGPHTFQGLREKGLRLLALARKESGLPIVTEVTSPEHVEVVAEYADLLQVGARNMQNFDLLKELGRLRKPVLLKRGMSATIEEFLSSAEYILAGGNADVILCERGIRTFEPSTRYTLDLSVVPLIKELSHLPIIVDPSHATGNGALFLPWPKRRWLPGRTAY